MQYEQLSVDLNKWWVLSQGGNSSVVEIRRNWI